jgi:CheY-like chemotaxis protein
LRVLVVEDHPDAADSTAQLLTLLGHEAHAALSAAEARAAVAAGFLPDLVLLDIILPDGDGYSLAAELCQLLAVRPVLVAVTGLPHQEDRCRAAGFDHHYLKPVDPEVLAALVKGYADRLAAGCEAQE